VPDTVNVNVSQFTPSTQVPSPFEAPPAAVVFQTTGCDDGVIVPDVGLAAPSRITFNRQTKLATKNPPAKIHRILFIERPPKRNRTPLRLRARSFAFIRDWALEVSFPHRGSVCFLASPSCFTRSAAAS
jgi:hypothetical protein